MTQHIPTALALAGILAGPPALSGAAPQATAAATAQDRDDTLKDRIAFRLDTSETVRKYDVKVKVDGGVATLSGDVATAAQKAEAEKLAKIDGIVRVQNDIAIDPDEDRSLGERMKAGMSKTGEKISDAWITTKVNWFFVGEDTLKGSRIDVDTKNNVVTLSGTVTSQAGRTRAVALAKQTEGVKDVVDRLTVTSVR